MRKVRYAPTTDPAVATAAYSHQGLRWLPARIASRMSSPPKVGRGELSRIARKNRPNAPRCRKMRVTFNIGNIASRGGTISSRRCDLCCPSAASRQVEHVTGVYREQQSLNFLPY